MSIRDATMPSGSVNNYFIELPSRISGPSRAPSHLDYTLSLRPHEKLLDVVKPGRNNRLRLKSLDLRIDWWRFGTVDDVSTYPGTAAMHQLPPTESAKLVAARPSWKDFTVVESLPVPPRVSIELSLSSGIVHRRGPPINTLQIVITNCGE